MKKSGEGAGHGRSHCVYIPYRRLLYIHVLLSIKDKKDIKDNAISQCLILEVKVTKVDGMKFGFADFKGAGVVHETVELPDKLWKASDAEQFKWLDEAIGGSRPGMTWHHTEIPGKMELVETGIHDIVPHN